DLKQFCIEFIQESLEICKNINEKDPVDELKIYYPKFINKKFDNVLVKNIKNYYEFVNKNEEIICSNDKFIIANTCVSEQKVIKNFFQEKFEKSEGVKTTNVEDSTRDVLLIFLTQYLEMQNGFVFNKLVFERIFKQFLFYANNEIRVVDFFTPLHNFESNIEKFDFGGIVLRRISEEEFMYVSGLGISRGYSTKISSDLIFLTHIAETTVSYEGNFYKENHHAKKKFEDFLRCLTLFSSGGIQTGALYRNHLNPWKQQSKSVEGKEIHHKSESLILNKKDCNAFLKFFKNYNSVDLERKELKFLKMAIQRFDSAIKKSLHEEKIVDFVISLESLYTSGPGDTRMKMSNRVATLMGENEELKESIWTFVSSAYNIRSGIVHGEGIRS